ncbi:glycine--tRNA ligase subunit alpha [Buchnera aphidicola (Mindarus keteleerifoliae)]|uniref:glycine--tRNA ligase subunit alpha n=1 Tax=Buchnera aphidicola TaxID=9 RepID=UPI0031B6EF87
MEKKNFLTIYDIICKLQKFWKKQDCCIIQPLDLPIGAGTFHHKTFFTTINSTPSKFGYVQASRRPYDGRYGENDNRLQHYYQFQIIIKPVPFNIQELYLESLKYISIDPTKNDIRFVEDDWKNTTLGAWGIGWEVWLNGMEITQFTYFQQVGGIDCFPITIEITYGLERISMHIQNIKNVYELIWSKNKTKEITYKDLFIQNEIEQSAYNFQYSNTQLLLNLFESHLSESKRLLSLKPNLLIPSYEHALYAIHNFNLLDAKKTMSSSERQKKILYIQTLTKEIAIRYKKSL